MKRIKSFWHRIRTAFGCPTIQGVIFENMPTISGEMRGLIIRNCKVKEAK